MSTPSGSLEPHRGTLILVLGILGLVVCAPCGVAAWLMAKGDLKKMDAGLMDPEGRGNTKVGMILGIIATVLLAISIVVIGIMLATGAGAMLMGGGQPVGPELQP